VPNEYTLYAGFIHLAAGLACGLTGMAAGYAIGVVGDAVSLFSVRAACMALTFMLSVCSCIRLRIKGFCYHDSNTDLCRSIRIIRVSTYHTTDSIMNLKPFTSNSLIVALILDTATSDSKC
jgi:hypothetical protein